MFQLLTQEIQTKVPFSSELKRAYNSNGAFAPAFRSLAKRREAVADAKPYSVAIVGFGDGYAYTNGGLCYVLDDTLRVLDIHKSAYSEVVVHVPRLLREFLLDTEQRTGRFLILYYNEGIVSCLYTLPEPEAEAYLIVINIWKRRLLLAYVLDCAEKIFSRHNSKLLYYGVYTGNAWDNRKNWVLRGYRFDEQKWFEQRIHLHDLIGSDIGSTICFEIHDEYFYALSNQTTAEVEEVDWTSFYHCMRFPIDSPCASLLEKTGLDKYMWRRQHREGPLDDRWGNLSLNVDEATGELKIVETRKEFRAGASTSRRTYYTTKLIFPEKPTEGAVSVPTSVPSSSSLSTIDPPANNLLALTGASSSATSSSTSTVLGKQELAALTNDRLALTLTPSDNPHWLTPQTRLPRNVHEGDDDLLVLFQTPFRYYNLSASTFVDMVDDRSSLYSQSAQRLRLRTGSRRLDPPARDKNGILVQHHSNSQAEEIMEGLDETFTALPVTLWPPEQDPYGQFDEGWDVIHKLLNPPTHIGSVEGTADERSLVYLTGSMDMPRAIILVNFDPAIKLRGLQKFRGGRGRGIKVKSRYDKEELGDMGSHTLEEEEPPKNKGKGKEKKKSEETQFSFQTPALKNRGWIWSEPAMYTVINRGFDFSY
jgi:hypothetical protein